MHTEWNNYLLTVASVRSCMQGNNCIFPSALPDKCWGIQRFPFQNQTKHQPEAKPGLQFLQHQSCCLCHCNIPLVLCASSCLEVTYIIWRNKWRIFTLQISVTVNDIKQYCKNLDKTSPCVYVLHHESVMESGGKAMWILNRSTIWMLYPWQSPWYPSSCRLGVTWCQYGKSFPLPGNKSQLCSLSWILFDKAILACLSPVKC